MALLAAACSEQTEGERCDPSNESTDCESGLRCVTLASLHRGTSGAVCCPENPSADICLQVDFTGNDEGAAPTSTVPAIATTTGPTTSTDAGMSLPPGDAATADAATTDSGLVAADAATTP